MNASREAASSTRMVKKIEDWGTAYKLFPQFLALSRFLGKTKNFPVRFPAHILAQEDQLNLPPVFCTVCPLYLQKGRSHSPSARRVKVATRVVLPLRLPVRIATRIARSESHLHPTGRSKVDTGQNPSDDRVH